MVITKPDFVKLYGPGRPPVAGSPNYTMLEDVLVLTALVDYFRSERCLEIGCNIGATSAALLAGNTTLKEYIGLDLPVIWFNNRNLAAGYLARDDPRFKVMQLQSGSRDPLVAAIKPVDFVFIDGNHEYKWVAWDSMLARKLLAPTGGVIAWHDYLYPTNPAIARWIHEANDRRFEEEPEIVAVQGSYTAYQVIQGK